MPKTPATNATTDTDLPEGLGLVIVESPAKAKTIEKFLGKGFVVQASIGHIRDLPNPKRGAPVPAKYKGTDEGRLGVIVGEQDAPVFEPIYVVPQDAKEQLKTLKRLLKDASVLWLATDEDREGEAISWHLLQELKPKVPVRRLVFNEITQEAIQAALANPRDVDMDLVSAQETRRILDRLYGYLVSPILWRKIGRGLSAGRVQSVALRLLVEREQERMRFHRATYWDLAATFADRGGKGGSFDADLVELGGKRIASGRDFDASTGKLQSDNVTLLDEAGARALAERLKTVDAKVASVEEKPYTQTPAPPFTTSTLQQEAGRKLRFSARRTMGVAQTLYQAGVITYMRTDSTALSTEAVEGARSFIRANYGDAFLPPSPRTYKSKVKNAQEAHEAIRPAGARFQTIDEVRKKHGKEAAALYELIWMRTVASQMPDARGRRVTVLVRADDAVFRASGKTIEFAGFMRAYVEGSDDPGAALADQDRLLPPLEVEQALATRELKPEGHETKPPARYTEASLVKELDGKGIGRPSTWASIIGVLLDRNYMFRKGGSLIPTFTGFVVVEMLKGHFEDLVDYAFTARLEDDLDEVSRGEGDRIVYLRDFYYGNGHAGLEDLVAKAADVDPRLTSRYLLGEFEGKPIHVRAGKFGLFLSDGETNASIPDDTVPDELTLEDAAQRLREAAEGPKPLGNDPATDLPVYAKSGRFGPYVQLGDAEEGGEKPKMQSLLPGMSLETLTLEEALRLLSLPRNLGPHPEDEEKKEVLALTGRYGPFVKWGSESRSIPDDVSVLDITLERAVELLKEPRRRGRAAKPAALKDLGKHPETEKDLKILSGRYGPYVTDGEINASLPRGRDPGELTMDEAVELLRRRAERIASGGGKPKRKKKAAAKKKKKKTTAKKKKPAAKKKAAPKKKKAP